MTEQKLRNTVELPIFKKTKELGLALFKYTENMPKHYKETLGEESTKLIIQLMYRISRANIDKPNRIKHLNEYLMLLEALKIVIMFMCESKILSTKQQAHLIDPLVNLDAQVNGWLKHTSQLTKVD